MNEKQKQINDLLDRLDYRFKEKLGRCYYLDKNAFTYFMQLLQKEINKIFDEEDIGW